MNTKYIIYALQDPQTFEIRYIGKSANGLRRPRAHTYPLSLKRDKTYKGNWLRSLINNGFKPIIKVVQELNNLQELNQAEQYWIEYFKNLDCPLTNSTKGGMGRCGLPHTEETKQKISSSNKEHAKRKPYPKGKKHWRYGKKRTEQEKQVISERTKECMQSPEIQYKLKNRAHYRRIQDNNGIVYSSIDEAKRHTKLDKGTIRRILSGTIDSCKGYSFKEIT